MSSPNIHALADHLAELMLTQNLAEKSGSKNYAYDVSHVIRNYRKALKLMEVSCEVKYRKNGDGDYWYDMLNVDGFKYDLKEMEDKAAEAGRIQDLIDKFLPVIRSLDHQAAGYTNFHYSPVTESIEVWYRGNHARNVPRGANDGETLENLLYAVLQNKERDYDNYDKGQD